jgi:uncharacterized protein (DUF1330 family)
MPAYVIAEVDITDQEGYEPYKSLAAAAIAANGGAYRVRGGDVDSLEGAPVTGRIVVLEFPDIEAARRWYHCADYQAALPIRQANSRGRVFLVDGYDPSA